MTIQIPQIDVNNFEIFFKKFPECIDLQQRSKTPRIYVSSKHKHATIWKNFEIRGYNIISSWIHLDGIIELDAVGKLWVRWLNEARSADYLIFYSTRGDDNHTSCLLEIGACLSAGGIVLHVGESETMRTGNGQLADFTYMPQWQRISNLEKAFQIASGDVTV